jgi:sporulation inhibitor KapD
MEQYVFLDFEFSMPENNVPRGSFTPEIIEAGIVTVCEDNITDTFSSFIKPIINPKLSSRCCEFLKISQSQVDNGIRLTDLANKIESITALAPTTIVTWGNSDLHILKASCQRQGGFSLGTFKELDLAEEYKRFFGGHNLTSLKNAVLDYVGADFDQRHRALDDALATYEVFKHYQKDRRFINSPNQTTIGDRLDMSKLLTLFQK